MLRDRPVCGLRSEHIQKKLLSETNQTFSYATDIVVALETTARDVTELQSKYTGASVSVHKVYAKKKSGHGGTRE
jgi:hypothetical protein